MRKLIRAIILSTVILTLMVAQTFTVYASTSVIYVTADKTEAEPGDTVYFTVSMGPVSDMGTMQMVLDIPEGLTYVKGSGKLASGLKKELGFDHADFTEKTLMINGMASDGDYSSGSDTELCTFSCTVDDGFKGKAEVGLTKLEFYSCETWEDHTGDYAVSKAVISVGNDSGQSTPAVPGSSSGSASAADQQSPPADTASGDQSGSNASQADDPGQSDASESTPPDSTEDGTSDAASGNAAEDKAEEQNSPAAWIIAAIAVILAGLIAAVLIRRKKNN